MPPSSGVDDAPSEGAIAPVPSSSPGEDHAIGPPPTSPVS